MEVFRDLLGVTSASLMAIACVSGKDSAMPRSTRDARPIAPSKQERAASRHLSPDDTVGDLLAVPAFRGFAELILPSDDRAYDLSMPLREIASLLPFHSQVRPDIVVGALNHMIDEVASGRTVFYDFTSETEKAAEPERRYTGLFFFRDKPGAPFAIICPGGGFSYVGLGHEGFPHASEISRQGYNAFVLRYRARRRANVATRDLAAAITYVRRNAKLLYVDPDDYSLWGSSAGARMAAYVGTHGTAAYGGAEDSKPATVVMAYTGHTESSSVEPPTFAVVGELDGIAPPSVMERRVDELRKHGTRVEFRRIEGVGHGFGLGTGAPAAGWVTDAVRFWATALAERRR